MKTIIAISILICTLLAQPVLGQNNVGIGTNTPDASAKIDITSANKGLLIPRVALTGTGDAVTIPSPATSLLVYNTATSGISPDNVIPGYYYNSGSSAAPVWTRLNTSATSDTLGWTKANTAFTKATKTDNQYVNGNVGIGDFSGSTPSDKLHILGSMRVDAGRIGVYNTGRSVYIGRECGVSDNFSTNLENVAIGLQSLLGNTGGSKNVAIGTFALASNKASSNVAIGHSSLVSNNAGSQNVGIGLNALINNTTGNNNVGLGYSALSANTTGNNNTAIGYQANTGTNNLSNATAIGSFAQVRSSNSLILGDTINGIKVGIGLTSPNPSAVLDISSDNKGVRLPNVALTSTTDASTISSPVTSLLIYNTATAGISPNNVTPGFYYNAGTSGSPVWTKLRAVTSPDEWSLTGNTGISAPAWPSVYGTSPIGSSENFLGTKDAKDLTFGTNNIERMRIQSASGNIGIGTANPTAKLEVANADAKINTLTIGKGGGSQFENTAIGADALLLNTSSGDQNTAIGYRVLNINNTGRLNTGAGVYSLQHNTSGSYNTGYGAGSLINNSTGIGNIGIGFNTMSANTTGSYNIVIGHSSNVGSNNLSNATAIGSNAMVRSSNSLILGDTINNIRVGIGTTAPDKSTVLDIYSTNKGIRLPNIALTSTTDASTITSPASSLLVYNTSTVNNVTPGFYYNSGTSASPVWKRLAPITDTLGWTKTSTMNTKATKTDNQYVTGNIGIGDFSAAEPDDKIHVKGNIKIDGGKIDFRNTGASVFIGENAGLNDDLANHYNTFTGYFSGKENTTGLYNTAYGAGSLETNITGNGNTAIGRLALLNSIGSNNTALGLYAGANTTGNGSVFIGNSAGENETGSNKLYIDNSSTSTPLIYGDFENRHLTVNDSLTATYFQMQDGAADNFILRSDASGNATWVSIASLDTTGWTKVLTANTKASKSDHQYVTGKVGIGDFSATTPNTTLQVIGNASIGAKNLNVTGTNAFAIGDTNIVTGKNSFSAGQINTNGAQNSITGGYFSRIESGTAYSIAVGFVDTIAASSSAAFGNNNKITAVGSLVAGNGNKITGQYSAGFGSFNNTSGIGALTTGNKNTTSGENSLTAGYTNLNAGENSIAAGFFTRIEDGYANSIVVGFTDTVAAASSAVFGYGNKATGSNSLISGDRNRVTALSAAAFGRYNTADGDISLSAGLYNTAASLAETSLGIYGTTYTPMSNSGFALADRLFNVGNGISTTARADAFTILKNGNIGIGIATPSNNVSFATGAHKTIGAERSTTAGTYYNLTIQAGGAMSGQNNNHGGDLILSGGIATGNGGSAADLGSNVIFKTATPLGSSSNADQTPTEKMRIKGDGTVNVATMAGTGNRTVTVDANGNLSASKNMVYVEDRAERTTDASNSGFRSIGNSTGNLAVNTGDVIAISLTLKFMWNGGSGTDQPKFGINITGCTSATVTDTYELGTADDFPRGQYQAVSLQYIYTATCNGNLQFNLLMDSNSNADDTAKTGDVVIVARKL